MFRKLGFVLALGLIVGLAALGPVASAASPAALVANGQWHTLTAGGQATYPFDYSGDSSQVLVRMAAPNGGSFEVLTPDQFSQWQTGASVEPVGRGSASDIFGGDLIWSGDFNTAGTYYVIVNAGNGETDYALTISGSGVTLPAAETTVAATAKPAASVKAAAKPAASEEAAEKTAAAKPAAEPKKGGTGPSDALTVNGEWATVAKNQEIWYAIPYGGGNAQVIVSMAVDPSTPATFAVYTQNEVTNGSDPVGRGSVDPSMGGNMVWSGGFADAGTIYVVVSGNGVGDTGYNLTVQ